MSICISIYIIICIRYFFSAAKLLIFFQKQAIMSENM